VEFSHHSLPAEKNLKEDPATYPQGAESIICIICSKESQFYRVILVLPSNWQTSLSVHGRSTISLPEKGKIHYFPLHNLNLYKQYASQAFVIQLVTLSPSIRATILDNSTIEKIIKNFCNCFQYKLKHFYSFSVFMIQAWKTYHNQVIKPKDVRVAIRSKLSTETRAFLAINTPQSETNLPIILSEDEEAAK
jgi:hypothetical protein